MDLSKYTILLTETSAGGFNIDGSEENVGQETLTETPVKTTDKANAEKPEGGFGFLGTILIYVVALGALFYFTSRSEKKREKAVKEAQDSIKIGDEVRTAGGFYGKVVDTQADTFIVEFGTNKGVRIPVRKLDVYPAVQVEVEKKKK